MSPVTPACALVHATAAKIRVINGCPLKMRCEWAVSVFAKDVTEIISDKTEVVIIVLKEYKQ